MEMNIAWSVYVLVLYGYMIGKCATQKCGWYMSLFNTMCAVQCYRTNLTMNYWFMIWTHVTLNVQCFIYHTDKRPYECTQCDYKAKTKPQLKVHVMRHSGKYVHTCSCLHLIRESATPYLHGTFYCCYCLSIIIEHSYSYSTFNAGLFYFVKEWSAVY